MHAPKLLITALSLILSGQLFSSEKQIKVIYGDDNRVDVYESKNSALVELSKSTAAMIANANIKARSDGSFEISDRTLAANGICAKERFSKQITAASCSAFLVSENVLVTAGHCITSIADCAKYKFAFDYKVDSAEQGNVIIPASSIYTCKKVISRELSVFSKNDFAVLELDRNVTDRRPLAIRRSGKIAKGEPLVVIGHPTGLPTKIADGANVRSLESKYFVANLDTYGGNSGSAVINTKTSEVEGILVRGENDYIQEGSCKVSYKCANDSCRGEDVTYITNIAALRMIQ